MKFRYNSMSDAGRSLAARAKRHFHKQYPDVRVGINAMEGWIEVEGKKAVNMSSASSRPMSLEDVVDQMKQAYLGHPIQENTMKITKRQLRQIIKEAVLDEYSSEDLYFGKDGVRAPHPLLDGNYVGNGYVLNVFDPAREWLELNRSKSQYFSLALDILGGRVKEEPTGRSTLAYFPFKFADELLDKMEDEGLPEELAQDIKIQMIGSDSEYNAPDW